MKETVVEVKDVSIKFNMSSEKYDSYIMKKKWSDLNARE